jgi:hypothetical protein
VSLAAAASCDASAPRPGAFAVRPAQFNPRDPVTRAYFKLSLTRNSSRTAAVLVKNSGGLPVHLLVYPVDGLTGETSGVVYGVRGSRLRGAGLWLTVKVVEVTVEPHAQRMIRFSIRVPADAAAGDHLAGVAVQDVKIVTTRSRFRILEVLREVVGVLVRVPGHAQPRLVLGQPSLAYGAGAPTATLRLPIANRGLALCKPRVELTLHGPGNLNRTLARQLDTILPGGAISYPLALAAGLGAGSYRLDARAGCTGSVSARTTTLRLSSAEVVRSNGTRRRLATTAGHGSSRAIWWLVALCAAIAVLKLFVAPRRRPVVHEQSR